MNRRLHVATLLLGLLFALSAQAGEWHDAANAGDMAKLKSLLAADAKLLNSPDGEGKTALHRAAARGNLDVAKFLVESGADVNLKTESGLTALKLATGFGRTEVADYLREHGTDSDPAAISKPVKAPPLPSIASITNTQRLNAFQKDLVKFADEVRRSPDRGFTPLHGAALDGNVTEIKRLLAGWFSNVEVRDNAGYTPLHWAAEAGQKAAVECLLDHKANINALAKGGDTPLTIAIIQQRGPVIQTLLDRKAALDASTNDFGPPLVLAAEHELLPVVVALLQGGADVNRTNRVHGWTALHWAAYRNNQRIVEALLAAKPRLDVLDRDGKTPLKLAEAHASQEIVDLFRQAAGLPVTGLTAGERKIIAAYERFENLERRGTLSEIRAAFFAMEPTPADQAQIFSANTNAVAKACASRKKWLEASWAQRKYYSRPQVTTTRIELGAPSPRIQRWQQKGWLNPEVRFYSISLWASGVRRAAQEGSGNSYCWVNGRLVKVPEDVLIEEVAERPKGSR